MDQGGRHDRQGLMLGPRLRLLLSGAVAGRVPSCRRWRAAAYRSVEFDFGGPGPGRRSHRSRHSGGRAPRRSHPGRRRCAAAAAHHRRHRRRALGSSDGREPPDPFVSRPRQGGCSRLTPLYSAEMATFPRYAIYYVSAPGSDLDRFGAQLLGYDAFSGEDLPFPDGILPSVPDWRDLTRDPRKYGFHATLKAPLSLAQGRTEAELLTACELFAGASRTIPVIAPVVDSISGFIAVVP